MVGLPVAFQPVCRGYVTPEPHTKPPRLPPKPSYNPMHSESLTGAEGILSRKTYVPLLLFSTCTCIWLNIGLHVVIELTLNYKNSWKALKVLQNSVGENDDSPTGVSLHTVYMGGVKTTIILVLSQPCNSIETSLMKNLMERDWGRGRPRISWLDVFPN